MAGRNKGKTEANQGEGNRTAAREFDEAQQRLVRSGKVEEKAKAAETAVEGKEGKEVAELRDAELIGKRHTAEEDPEVKR
ncbi:MAG TPA: hypothetical protein VE397_15530 [Stellaceae bacterium]|jgi:hypothetical protein|nr:hypothetical protein [Stellaceae bacterium]